MTKPTYKEMYREAATEVNYLHGSYKGYKGGNALSLYVNDKYGVNAADETAAHNALLCAMPLLEDIN